eukprot:GCRY01001908.1.p1 GENE.GCRY01001908.1~~GCRY01001908.1.p1  ORF type:complete len:218 (+),score=31.41 GCRY01001908.1:228-881(+)
MLSSLRSVVRLPGTRYATTIPSFSLAFANRMAVTPLTATRSFTTEDKEPFQTPETPCSDFCSDCSEHEIVENQTCTDPCCCGDAHHHHHSHTHECATSGPSDPVGFKIMKLFKYSSYSLGALAPVAIALSPHPLVLPFDLAMGVIIPFHTYIGTSHIAEDYVPRRFLSGAKVVLLTLSAMAGLGFLRMNLKGKGLTETMKSLWVEEEGDETLAVVTQ